MVTTSTGTLIDVSVELPAANDQASFEAIAAWTRVGQIATVAEFGPSREEVTFTPIDTGDQAIIAGSTSYGTFSCTYGDELADAGQVLVENALPTNTAISFRITRPNGKIHYFTARVLNFTVNPDNANAVSGGSLSAGLDQGMITVRP